MHRDSRSALPLSTINPIRAAAVAAGARIAALLDAPSIMKVVQSKNSIRFRAGEAFSSKVLSSLPACYYAASELAGSASVNSGFGFLESLAKVEAEETPNMNFADSEKLMVRRS